MKRHTDNKTPSAKVGVALIVVVLIVVGTIFGSKIQLKRPVADLQNVELLIERKSMDSFKSGDEDQDNLPDWLEEFYRTDPKNPDTDGDGTPDGEEVTLDRDPAVAGPNDPLITRKDLIADVNPDSFKQGTLTEKMSIDLFTKYINLKKQGQFTSEDGSKITDELAQEVAKQASLRDVYSLDELNIVESSKETVEIYGDRLAQNIFSFLTRLDGHKYLKGKEYIEKVSKEYESFAIELSQMRVPNVVQEPHLALANYMHKTSVFYASLNAGDGDPLSSLVVLNQYKQIELTDERLYTILAEYFKNNGIIFTTESTIRFWSQFQS